MIKLAYGVEHDFRNFRYWYRMIEDNPHPQTVSYFHLSLSSISQLHSLLPYELQNAKCRCLEDIKFFLLLYILSR
ncbi:hypothetical protein DAPPUDRAFT_309007 [Daphnia pulex]|uniref:Uncharacterized protein n=1 Tax=Daphnia pulex TaxID=6669 RepID=E9G3U1_DAPPU|nr:hypothetical protein DAPPUDRAFT_309007 [Daphnia pulex]|eukprot:EFX85929.1 hypothetical protein DAPPUDRAFT_309007 [Daphnia pulex]